MAINKKHFRRIEVEGDVYYWKVRPDQWMLKLFITKGDKSASSLHTMFKQETVQEFPHATTQKTDLVITSRLIRAVIEYALSIGWTPDRKGDDLHITAPASIPFLRKIETQNSSENSND